MGSVPFSRISGEDLHDMCVRGDESAWRYLYNYVVKILRAGQWRLPVEVEDMAQQILCHLLAGSIDKVKHKHAFRAFVRRVAVNQVLDTLKKKRLMVVSYDREDVHREKIFACAAPAGPGPEEAAMGNCAAGSIEKALARLSDGCREVLSAYIDYKLGMIENYQALARQFGETMGTISSRINRCLGKLKQMPEIRQMTHKEPG
jgi:RNA polymerase sigma factor (sigma-70 family)